MEKLFYTPAEGVWCAVAEPMEENRGSFVKGT